MPNSSPSSENHPVTHDSAHSQQTKIEKKQLSTVSSLLTQVSNIAGTVLLSSVATYPFKMVISFNRKNQKKWTIGKQPLENRQSIIAAGKGVVDFSTHYIRNTLGASLKFGCNKSIARETLPHHKRLLENESEALRINQGLEINESIETRKSTETRHPTEIVSATTSEQAIQEGEPQKNRKNTPGMNQFLLPITLTVSLAGAESVITGYTAASLALKKASTIVPGFVAPSQPVLNSMSFRGYSEYLLGVFHYSRVGFCVRTAKTSLEIGAFFMHELLQRPLAENGVNANVAWAGSLAAVALFTGPFISLASKTYQDQIEKMSPDSLKVPSGTSILRDAGLKGTINVLKGVNSRATIFMTATYLLVVPKAQEITEKIISKKLAPTLFGIEKILEKNESPDSPSNPGRFIGGY